MPEDTLKIVLSDSAKKMYFKKYLKRKKLLKTLEFVLNSVDKDDIYDIYFAGKPQIAVAGLEKHRKRAQAFYNKAVDELVEEGEKPSEAHQRVIGNSAFYKLYQHGRATIDENFTNKFIPDWKTQSEYEEYVETQVDGSLMASKMKLPSSANDLCQSVKVALILGKDAQAKKFAQMAIDKKIAADTKGNKRAKISVPKVTDVIKLAKTVRIPV